MDNNSRAKILYITQSFGGVEIYIRQIIENINFTKFQIEIIAPPNPSFEFFCIQNNIIYYPIEMARGIDIKKDYSAYRRIKKIIKENAPDIIHAHSSKAGVLGRLISSKLGVKCVFTPHGLSYLSFSGLKRVFFLAVETFMKKYTDQVLACSDSEKIKYEFEVGFTPNRVKAIANAVNVSQDYSSSKRIFTSESETIKIGSIARLTYQKNPLLLIKVSKYIADLYPKIKFEFSILGSGLTDHLKNETIALIEELGLQDDYTLLGWGDQEKSRQYLESLDIFILPSVFEGLPLSVLEAMSLGTISITSKCDGCNDVIQNMENGFACMTPEQYVNKISAIIEEPELQKEIRINAYNYVKKYHNLKKFITEIESYYLSIMMNSTCES